MSEYKNDYHVGTLQDQDCDLYASVCFFSVSLKLFF